jgi:hypothetical protein
MIDTITQSQLNKSRLDKFLLVIDLPPIMQNIVTKKLPSPAPFKRTGTLVNKNSLQFSVYGSVIPTVQVPDVAADFSGGTYKLSSNSRPRYENISVNFTIDNKFNNYWVIYKWLDILSGDTEVVYNPDDILPSEPDSTKLPTKLQPQSYQTNFTLYGKDEFDTNVIKFTYTKAFPVSLGSFTYNYRDPSELETTFEFAFSQFYAELI